MVDMNEDMIVKIVMKMIDNMPIIILFLFKTENKRPCRKLISFCFRY